MIGILFLTVGLALSSSGLEIDFGGGGRGTGREPVLCRAYIGFERGELESAKGLLLCDGCASPVPSDFHPTARWDDGSVRCLAITAAVPFHRAKGCFTLYHPRRTRRVEAPAAIQVSRRAEVVTVDTGSMTIVLDGREGRFITGFGRHGREIPELAEGWDLCLELDGLPYRPRRCALVVFEGRAAAEARFLGWLVDRAGGRGPSFELSLRFLAGSSCIAISLVFEGGDLEGASRGVVLRFHPPWRIVTAPVVVAALNGSREQVASRSGTILLRSRPTGVVFEEKLRDQETALPKSDGKHIVLKGCVPALGLELPRFGHLHPWSVTITPGGSVALSLLNESFAWSPGFSFRRDLTLHLYGRGRSNPTPTQTIWGLAADAAHRKLLHVRGGAPSETDPLMALYLEVTAGLRSSLRREWARWDGVLNYGDYRKAYGIWANGEYDPAAGLIKRYLWTGDAEDLAMAKRILDHWLIHDRAGREDPDADEGLPWMHGSEHRSGEIEIGHMWLEGALLYGLLTGERVYLDAAYRIGEYFAQQTSRLRSTRLERSVAWALIGLCALVDAGQERFRDAMDRVAAGLRRRQADSGLMVFKTTKYAEEECYEINTWVSAGITAEALFQHGRVAGDDRSWEAAAKLVKAVVSHGWDGERGRFAQRLFWSPRRGRLAGRSGRLNGGVAALLSLGAIRAHRLTGNRGLRSIARTQLEKALLALDQRPPRYPGEELSMILRVGLDGIDEIADR